MHYLVVIYHLPVIQGGDQRLGNTRYKRQFYHRKNVEKNDYKRHNYTKMTLTGKLK